MRGGPGSPTTLVPGSTRSPRGQRRFSRFPSAPGIGPVNAFERRISTVRWTRFPSVDGIGPVNEFSNHCCKVAVPPASEIHSLQKRKVAERGRNGTGQRIAGQMQLRYPTGCVGRHPVPFAQRRRCLPVRAVRPALASGRVVERLQRRTIRRVASLRNRLRTMTRPDGNEQQQWRQPRTVITTSQRRQIHGHGARSCATHQRRGRTINT